MTKLNDKWFRFLGIPFIALMGHILFYNRNESPEQPFGFWMIYLISLIETMVLWEANRVVILYCRRRYPNLDQTTRRFIIVLLTAIVVTILIRSLNIWLYDVTEFWGGSYPFEAYLKDIFVAVLFVVIVGGIYEGIYYFFKWKEAAIESELLKNENLQTQLASLKAQINPHFLFNSLSSLESLIDDDTDKAKAFVGELSWVYRYLLQNNESSLTTLDKEKQFVTAYMKLLKTRFGEGIQLSIDIQEQYLEYLLPPLTLQLLIENAVKHNVILPEKPLLIKIYSDVDGNLFVRNNRQPKKSGVVSNKLGLMNISSKYKLLRQSAIQVKETKEAFLVTIPLIKNSVHASINN